MLNWIKGNKWWLLVFLLTITVCLYQINRSNKKSIQLQSEYYERIIKWKARENRYQSTIDSVNAIHDKTQDSINALVSEVDELKNKIQDYETTIDDYVDRINDDDLIDSIRARYLNKD